MPTRGAGDARRNLAAHVLIDNWLSQDPTNETQTKNLSPYLKKKVLANLNFSWTTVLLWIAILPGSQNCDFTHQAEEKLLVWLIFWRKSAKRTNILKSSGQTGCPIMSNNAPIHLDLVSPSQERGWALLQAVEEKGLVDFSDIILQAWYLSKQHHHQI